MLVYELCRYYNARYNNKKNGISFFTLSSVVFFWDGTLTSNQISPHTVADL